MDGRQSGRWIRWVLLVAGLAAAVALAGCGAGTGGDATADGNARGSVSVLYAGSLEQLMNQRIGPAFERATGYRFEGFPAGSTDLANEIKGKVRRADVFLSAAPTVNATLEGRANGDWVSWYAPFASTALALGYNPHSRFASQLKTKPWYRVITEPGFRLGFTDPKLDPKGVLAVGALDQAARQHSEPALRRIAADQDDLFPEQDLVGRLQSGQLDAGFFYTVEARAAGIPSVSLAPIVKRGVYTITVLNQAPDPRGAEAFVRFLLGPEGSRLLRSGALTTIAPRVVGTNVPAALGSTLHSGRPTAPGETTPVAHPSS